MSADSYASRILSVRRKAGIGQRQLARMLGVGASTVQNYEHARRRPQGVYLAKLEAILCQLEDGHARSTEKPAQGKTGSSE